MGKLLDKLKDDLNMIVYKPEFIYDKYFMMGMIDPWVAEFPLFQDYMYHKIKQQKTNYLNSTSTIKAVSLKDILKDMFSLTSQDNKDSTQILEELGVIFATRWVQELLYPN